VVGSFEINGDYNTFDNCQSIGGTAPMAAVIFRNAATGNQLSNFYIYNCPVIGVDLIETCYGNELTNFYVRGATGYGYYFTNSASNNKLVNCQAIDGSSYGFYLSSTTANFNTLISCLAKGNALSGFKVYNAYDSTFIDCESYLNIRNGWELAHLLRTKFSLCSAVDNSQASDGTYYGFEIYDAQYCTFSECSAYSNLAKRQGRGIEEESTSNYNNYIACRSSGNIVNWLMVGANNKYFSNQNYVTESSGSATLLANQNHVHVTHGLSYTPSINDIHLTRTGPNSNCTALWVDPATITSTEFQVFCGTTAQKLTDANILFNWDSFKP
jgi:hypothetical protein